MTEKKDKFNYKFLPDYAAFLLREKLYDFVKEGLIISREEGLPVLKYFAAFSDEQIIEMGLKSNKELLTALANNQAKKYTENALIKWDANDIEVIEKDDLTAEDITIVAFIITKLLRKFLSFYTKDFDLYNNILEDIDRFVTGAANVGFNAYMSFQKEEIKKINSTLSSREEQLLEAQQLAQLGSFSWDLTGAKDSYYSPETLKIFGLEKSSDLDSFREDVHPDDRDLLIKAINDAINGGGIYEYEYRYIKPNHEKRIWSRGIVEFKDNKPVRMKGSIMDVTKNYQLVQDLKEKTENLKQLITTEKNNQTELRKKTLQLLELNNSLASKNAELERINKELESFNYVASHDLQEPLRKIRIYSNRLIEKDIAILPQRTLEYIDKIQSSSIWMQRLIEDLLSFSQLSSTSEAYEETDLNKILEEVKITLAESIEEKKVVIEAEHLPIIKAIPFQLSQLFVNIISNSIRYGKENSAPYIRIHSATVDGIPVDEAPPGKYLQLTIADNGIGFEAEYAEKIFDLFKRLHTKGKYTGTGIGLSICKKIVQHHNGFIKAESIQGDGATFHIFLPLDEH